MRQFIVFLLLTAPAAIAQDTIKIDTTDVFRVCTVRQDNAEGPCASAPRVTKRIDPVYTDKARKAKREGIVKLGLIVDPDGSTRDIHVLSSVGEGLDEAAIKAVQEWKFEPGKYQDKPVPVQLAVEVSFSLMPKTSTAPVGMAAEARNLFVEAGEAQGRGDYGRSVEFARKAIELKPRDPQLYNLLGTSLLELHELNAAAEALETAVKLDPASGYAYNNLGRVYWVQRRYDDAAVQFEKQIAINPNDPYAHGNLGLMLRDQKKCGLAVPSFEKALAITPEKPILLLGLGECHIDTGDARKGISELEEATSQSSSAGTWNSAAYALAQRNLELERARKWAENAIAIESTQMQNTSLEHLSTAQLGRVNSIASYWDTLGWVYFRLGDLEKAGNYLEAAWSLRQIPVIGDHLGQLYEALGKQDDAKRTYAMAVASADQPVIRPLNADSVESVEHARSRLSNFEGKDKLVKKSVEQGQSDLWQSRRLSVPKNGEAAGTADWALIAIAPGKVKATKQLSGGASLAWFDQILQSETLPEKFPGDSAVEIPRRGTLTCSSNESNCQFVLLTADDTLEVGRKESAADLSALTATSPTQDPHSFESVSLGMKVTLPDEWRLMHEDRGSFARPHSALLARTGTLAYVVLTREHVEASDQLYGKMLEAGFSQHEEYRRSGEMAVKRDGIDGRRWNMAWKDKDISYNVLAEFFTVENDHYRIIAMAPSEVYSRYNEDFEEIIRSLKFPLLHTDPKLLEKP